jgi:hypothetical protein
MVEDGGEEEFHSRDGVFDEDELGGGGRGTVRLAASEQLGGGGEGRGAQGEASRGELRG